MLGKRLIKSNDAGGGGCINTVDLYNPFPDGGGVALYQLNGDATDVSGNYDGTATNVTYGTPDAVGFADQASLDSYIANRNKAAEYYDKAFENVSWLTIPYRDPKSTHVFHQYTLKTKGINRDELRSYLSEKGIPAMVYYPLPLHKQKAYQDSRYDKVDFTNTEALNASVISLPMHTELTEEELLYITETVKEFK